MSRLDQRRASIQDTFDFIERCHSYTSLKPLFADFANIIAGYGFHTFVLSGMPAFGYDIKSLVVENQWPEEWTKRYLSRNYFADDPVSRWSLTHSKPFLWSEARKQFSNYKRAQQIATEASEFGLVDGVVLPIYDANSRHAVASLAMDRPCDLGRREIGSLYTVVAYTKMAISDIQATSEQDHSPLSARECEVLQWVTCGKTAWEISCILNISESTVERHLVNIRAKLNAVNTVQAVVKGIRRRQIQL